MSLLNSKAEITTISDNDELYIAKVDGTAPDGYVDRRAKKSNILKEVVSDITTNSTNITNLSSRVTTLENLTSIQQDGRKVTSYSFTLAAHTMIDGIIIYTEATVNVSVGTTSGGEDIMSNREISEEYKILSNKYINSTNKTIYVTLTGGTAEFAFLLVTNPLNKS